MAVPGLSASSSPGSDQSASRTLSRQESHYSTSSSSSSSSPTVTSSDDVTREREDQNGIDSPPVPVSSLNVEEMIERRDPLFAPESGKRSQANQNLKPNKEENTIERGDAVQSMPIIL